MTFQITIPIPNNSIEHPKLEPFSLFFSCNKSITVLDALASIIDGSTDKMRLDCITQLMLVSFKDANIPVDTFHIFKFIDPVFGSQYITVEKINVIVL
jgi:hypothetical protein